MHQRMALFLLLLLLLLFKEVKLNSAIVVKPTQYDYDIFGKGKSFGHFDIASNLQGSVLGKFCCFSLCCCGFFLHIAYIESQPDFKQTCMPAKDIQPCPLYNWRHSRLKKCDMKSTDDSVKLVSYKRNSILDIIDSVDTGKSSHIIIYHEVISRYQEWLWSTYHIVDNVKKSECSYR